jgi:hypothetical protein
MSQILVRLKVVYDWVESKKADYTRLPFQHAYTFIEPMTVPKGQSKIKILTLDKIQRTYVPDSETASPNGFEGPQIEVVANADDDLPF